MSTTRASNSLPTWKQYSVNFTCHDYHKVNGDMLHNIVEAHTVSLISTSRLSLMSRKDTVRYNTTVERFSKGRNVLLLCCI